MDDKPREPEAMEETAADTSERHPKPPETKEPADAEYVRGGKGRRDEVGRSGIYPASAGQAPADAEIVGQEELGHRHPGRKH